MLVVTGGPRANVDVVLTRNKINTIVHILDASLKIFRAGACIHGDAEFYYDA